jgi:hypothetical protein
MGKQISRNIARILTVFIVATLISSVALSERIKYYDPSDDLLNDNSHHSNDNSKQSNDNSKQGNDNSKQGNDNSQQGNDNSQRGNDHSRQSTDSSQKVNFDVDNVLKNLNDGDWTGVLTNFNPEKTSARTSEKDHNGNGGSEKDHNGNGGSEDNNGGCDNCGYDNGGYNGGYGGYGGWGGGYGVAAIPVAPMYGSPMYGNAPAMVGGEPSTTEVPSEPTVKVSSSKCHKDKCVLSKHKHKHTHKSKKHNAKKGC